MERLTEESEHTAEAGIASGAVPAACSLFILSASLALGLPRPATRPPLPALLFQFTGRRIFVSRRTWLQAVETVPRKDGHACLQNTLAFAGSSRTCHFLIFCIDLHIFFLHLGLISLFQSGCQGATNEEEEEGCLYFLNIVGFAVHGKMIGLAIYFACPRDVFAPFSTPKSQTPLHWELNQGDAASTLHKCTTVLGQWRHDLMGSNNGCYTICICMTELPGRICPLFHFAA